MTKTIGFSEKYKLNVKKRKLIHETKVVTKVMMMKKALESKLNLSQLMISWQIPMKKMMLYWVITRTMTKNEHKKLKRIERNTSHTLQKMKEMI